MRNRSKLLIKVLIAAISATALLGMIAGGASARSLEVTNWENGFRIVWNPLRLEAGGREASCPVTLEGTFERHTFAKLTSERVGKVTEAAVGTCTRNTATALRETLPWEVKYNSFGGTLPSITSITLNLIRASFQATLEGVTCLARTENSRPARGIATVSGTSITGFRADETAGIETTGGFFCSIAGASHFNGNATSITSRGRTERIGIRLI